MSDTHPLFMRALEPAEVELALSLADSLAAAPGRLIESFGVSRVRNRQFGKVLGLWIKGGLAGALWLGLPDSAGAMEVLALALGGAWRKMGIAAWMLGEAAGAGDGRRLFADVDGGGAEMGVALTEAGFAGPDPLGDLYPEGKWSKP